MRLKKGKQKMKKVLVLAALVVAGVAANAASFKWTASNVYSSDLTTKFNGSATLYAYLSSAEASTAVSIATGTIVSGAIKDGTTTGLTFDTDALTAGNTYNFYMVVEDGDNIFTSAEKTGISAQATATSTVAFGSLASQTQNASNWAGSAVPEPTSGLLMLLGMAGLALKRKRA